MLYRVMLGCCDGYRSDSQDAARTDTAFAATVAMKATASHDQRDFLSCSELIFRRLIMRGENIDSGLAFSARRLRSAIC